MNDEALKEIPLRGQTFSLFGNSESSSGYYHAIAGLADEAISRGGDPERLIGIIRRSAGAKRALRRQARTGDPERSIVPFLLKRSREVLSAYTADVEAHLGGLSFWRRHDRTLATSEEQYHLAMLEIELVNRLCADAFRASAAKLAFLPHCLHDFAGDCRAAPRGLDYVCKGCSPGCRVNAATRILRRARVKPYIWMTADLKKQFRRQKEAGERPGVLGVACVPELVRGMRLCMRSGVPVVGVPLNANRCRRWTGSFHETSVNLDVIAALAGQSKG